MKKMCLISHSSGDQEAESIVPVSCEGSLAASSCGEAERLMDAWGENIESRLTLSCTVWGATNPLSWGSLHFPE